MNQKLYKLTQISDLLRPHDHLREPLQKVKGIGRDIVNRLLDEVSSCPRCLRWGGTPFCSKCWDHLYQQMHLQTRMITPNIKVISLFDWDTDLIGSLVYSLKGGWRRKTWRNLAWSFMSRAYLHQGNHPAQALIVPAPPKAEWLPDHASTWAQEFSIILNCPLWQGLKRVPTGVQHLKSRTERQAVQLMRKTHIPEAFRNPQKLIFVDDVVTTGGTARSAQQALTEAQAKEFEVWCLAYRPLKNM